MHHAIINQTAPTSHVALSTTQEHTKHKVRATGHRWSELYHFHLGCMGRQLIARRRHRRDLHDAVESTRSDLLQQGQLLPGRGRGCPRALSEGEVGRTCCLQGASLLGFVKQRMLCRYIFGLLSIVSRLLLQVRKRTSLGSHVRMIHQSINLHTDHHFRLSSSIHSVWRRCDSLLCSAR